MTRQQFLSDYWKKYPVAPEGDPWLGRVVEITVQDGGTTVTLERQQKISTMNFAHLVIAETAVVKTNAIKDLTLDPRKILTPGDLIAIQDGVVTLLAPQLSPLPKRQFNSQVLSLWQEYLRAVHEFFRSEGFLQVATPTLVTCPGTEPTLDPFVTEFIMGSRREKRMLPTSPELHLKKALSLGAEKIFEVRSCFRNSEVTEHHQPEFTMIEWYRAFADLEFIQKDVQNLVDYLVRHVPGLRAPRAVKTATVRELFKTRCDYNLTPATTKSELSALASTLGIDVSSAKDVDDYFFLIFLEKIESQFSKDEMTFVLDYPPYQAALARIDENGWGERFEMYWQGLEIANAFHELNDPEIQKKRFAEDLAKKQRLGKEAIELDSEFMQCLEAGMPPSSGIALGLERLFMAMTGIQKISVTRLFPLA